MITSGGLSNLLRRVVANGYIRRDSDPRDRRGVIVELTEAGMALSEEAMIAQAQIERDLVSALSDEEQKVLADLLRRLVIANR